MSSRVLAGFLAATIALPSFPASARAGSEEGADSTVGEASATVVRLEPPEVWQERIGLGLGSRPLAVAASRPLERGLGSGGLGQEIRLSSGAKTAIIVTAIVVGVLIIVGVIAVGKPHKHL